MKVRIIKAGDDGFWYSKHIGETFEVERSQNKYLEFVVIPRDVNGTFYIDADDCEIVEEQAEGQQPTE